MCNRKIIYFILSFYLFCQKKKDSLLLCTNFVISSGESCLWLIIARSIKLFTDHRRVFAFLVRCKILHQRMVCIQNKGLLSSKHARIHAVHIIHFHHVLHTAAFFRKNHHSRYRFIFQIFNSNFQFLLIQAFTEKLCQRFCCFLICSAFSLQFLSKIRVNSFKLNCLILCSR